jgi:hypothetical protein
MKPIRCVTCAASVFLAATLVSGAPPERTVSSSRQFILYGADLSLRGAISHLAEETKTNLLSLLRRPDSWKTPIVINLQFPQANLPEIPPAALRFSQTGSGLKLQLDLTIASNFNRAATQRELLRAILLEMIYRDQPDIAAGQTYVDPPDWLLDGALAYAMDRDLKLLAEALEPLAATDKIMPLSEFLRPRKNSELDSPAHTLYRAYSATLVKWLVEESEGQSRLGFYIDHLSRSSAEPMASLKAHFAALNDPAVEQIWKSRVMPFAKLPITDVRRNAAAPRRNTGHQSFGPRQRKQRDQTGGSIAPQTFRAGGCCSRRNESKTLVPWFEFQSCSPSHRYGISADRSSPRRRQTLGNRPAARAASGFTSKPHESNEQNRQLSELV